ncbi:hypothetical protein D3C78_1472940 [compost metagenome]
MSERGENNFLSQILLRYFMPKNGKDELCTTSCSIDYSFIYTVHGSIGVINHWLETESMESPKMIAGIISNLGHKNKLAQLVDNLSLTNNS